MNTLPACGENSRLTPVQERRPCLSKAGAMADTPDENAVKDALRKLREFMEGLAADYDEAADEALKRYASEEHQGSFPDWLHPDVDPDEPDNSDPNDNDASGFNKGP